MKYKYNFFKPSVHWDSKSVISASYKCSYCGTFVTSAEGLPLVDENYVAQKHFSKPSGGVYICPNCSYPTYIYQDEQVPLSRFGESIEYLPEKVEKIYEEARDSFSVGAYTAVMLLCRKLLMHVAVDLGADENKKFIDYVNYFETEGYISKNAKPWVDKIRKLGNEANHEILIGNREDAKKIIEFSAMLLKTNYEYPGKIED